MIYEVRTYDMKPGAVPQAEEAFAEALPYREKYSPIAPSGTPRWAAEPDHPRLGLRQPGRAGAYPRRGEPGAQLASQNHPGQHREHELRGLDAGPFMRPMGGDQALGNIYEMRVYTYENGSMPELLRRWADSLPYREEFSPLAAGMYTEFGNLNRWMHVWPYKDLNHRAEVRAEASKIPQWPSGAPGRVSQENKIMIPASFSPMH
ncbi:Protein NipSnap homolog 1 [Geodia barretti]|uniref:Protein NipSnap homolog 1 n=1 Tax=Geodia barretti TaxID=519541 RepID=A0AA35WDB5_GEOBA|nr:Protein NipSnap homolog 1 [Geodia barretti]